MLKVDQTFMSYFDSQIIRRSIKIFCDYSTSDCRTLKYIARKNIRKNQDTRCFKSLKYYFI